MRCRRRRGRALWSPAALVAAAVVATVHLAARVHAHPLCLNFESPQPAGDYWYSFCAHVNTNNEGGCCSAEEDAQLGAAFKARVRGAIGDVSEECRTLLTELMCGPCLPWSAHLYQELELALGREEGMMLCSDFCGQLYSECGAVLPLPSNFCASRSRDPDAYYCYPDTPRASDVGGVGAGEGGGPQTLEPAFPYLQDLWPLQMTTMALRPDANAWWIMEQAGQVWEFDNDPAAVDLRLVLDLRERVRSGGELGLLGLAFHPNFATNGAFYLDYTDTLSQTVVSRFTLSEGDSAATLASEGVLLTWDNQENSNHKGGWLGFSPQDMATPDYDTHYLYISSGDGGGANDDHGDPGHSQDLDSPLGKILRVAVSQEQAAAAAFPPYCTPPDDNPFAGGLAGVSSVGVVAGRGLATITASDGAAELEVMFDGSVGDAGAASGSDGGGGATQRDLPEGSSTSAAQQPEGPFRDYVYAYGLRNPWRCAFDRGGAGELFCADVGQDRIEEINIIVAGGNYGWRDYEGDRCNVDARTADCGLDQIPPIASYCHADFQLAPKPEDWDDSQRVCAGQQVSGQSVTGGHVYRGSLFAEVLDGHYVFADYGVRVLASVYYDGTEEVWRQRALGDAGSGVGQISAFAEDADGELYAVSYEPPGVMRLACATCVHDQLQASEEVDAEPEADTARHTRHRPQASAAPAARGAAAAVALLGVAAGVALSAAQARLLF